MAVVEVFDLDREHWVHVEDYLPSLAFVEIEDVKPFSYNRKEYLSIKITLDDEEVIEHEGRRIRFKKVNVILPWSLWLLRKCDE